MAKNKIFTKIISALVSLVFAFCALLCSIVVLQKLKGDEPSLFGYRFYMIISPSMTPTIPVDSVVIVKKQDNYSIDDVITFKAQSGEIAGEPNTHRIVDIKVENNITYYQTKGDANTDPDADWVYDTIIYGKVVKSFQSDLFKKFTDILKQPIGYVLLILIPICIISFFIIKDYVKEYKREVKKLQEQEEVERIKKEIEKLKNKTN